MASSYIVVDQNQLRSQALRDRFVQEPHTRFVLPDLGMFEMAKSSNRALTLRLSLEVLSLQPSRVYVSRALGDCLRYELTRTIPVVGHVIDTNGTRFFRRVLAAVASGVSTPEYDRVLADPEGHVGGMRRDYLDHESNKRRMLELVEETKQAMPREFAQRLRAAQVSASEKVAFIREKAPSLLLDILADNGITRGKAERFIGQKPMLLRYMFLKLWACLCWEEQGRIDGLSAAKVSNDLIDHEYVLAATFFDGILSAESNVNEAYKAVTTLISRS